MEGWEELVEGDSMNIAFLEFFIGVCLLFNGREYLWNLNWSKEILNSCISDDGNIRVKYCMCFFR